MNNHKKDIQKLKPMSFLSVINDYAELYGAAIIKMLKMMDCTKKEYIVDTKKWKRRSILSKPEIITQIFLFPKEKEEYDYWVFADDKQPNDGYEIWCQYVCDERGDENRRAVQDIETLDLIYNYLRLEVKK